jgi:hypothetical protein
MQICDRTNLRINLYHENRVPELPDRHFLERDDSTQERERRLGPILRISSGRNLRAKHQLCQI